MPADYAPSGSAPARTGPRRGPHALLHRPHVGRRTTARRRAAVPQPGSYTSGRRARARAGAPRRAWSFPTIWGSGLRRGELRRSNAAANLRQLVEHLDRARDARHPRLGGPSGRARSSMSPSGRGTRCGQLDDLPDAVRREEVHELALSLAGWSWTPHLIPWRLWGGARQP